VAAAANGPEVQHIQVLMQDERLGRIALRMVDRAGLIHAVVRTEGTQTAQVLSDSLPALLESLSQRGLLATWTSTQSDGQPQADPRQGQPRRQRDSPGAGGHRPGRIRAPAFQLEAG
jgi:flagellar hook-length control protein FliK